MKKSSIRENFSGSLAAILALAGSAVGLGNLWRFPYLVGENGGAAFILIYIILAIIICLPVMMGEFIVGKRSQANVFRAYTSLTSSGFWRIIPIFSIFSVILILSFYSVVGGWGVEYLVKSLSFSFTRSGAQSELGSMFSDFVSNPYKPLVFHTIFLGMTAAIVAFGIKKGIERFSEVMMPTLFVLMVIIAIRSITIPESGQGLKYLFLPDFSKVDSNVIVKALGQAFFSLSLGCGTVVTYASYVKKETNIIK